MSHKQKKRDIADKFPCICPTRKKKRDIANKFLYICPEREKKKIQPADFHTYANIQKAMEMLEIERADVRQLKQNMGN